MQRISAESPMATTQCELPLVPRQIALPINIGIAKLARNSTILSVANAKISNQFSEKLGIIHPLNGSCVVAGWSCSEKTQREMRNLEMKKLFTFAFIAMLSLGTVSFVGCGGDDNGTSTETEGTDDGGGEDGDGEDGGDDTSS